jgi:hypothetical protein
VKALPDPERAHHDGEENGRDGAVDAAADDRHGHRAGRPQRTEDGKHPPAPVTLRQLRDGQLRHDDHDGVEEEDQTDGGLVDADLVHREHGEELEP